MIDKENQPDNKASSAKYVQALRRRAEAIARQYLTQSSENRTLLSVEDMQLALHELRVHQIELEMQNEELRRTQIELDIERARYFDLYDLAPVGFFSVNAQGLILQANLTASLQLGVTRGLLLKQPLSRFILREDQDLYYLYRKKLSALAGPQPCELRMVKSDGSSFWAQLSATVTQDVDGAPSHHLALNDITQRKQAEAALQESERRYRTLVEWSPEAVAVHRNGELLYVNPAAIKMFGAASAQDLLGKPMLDFVHPAFQQAVAARSKKVCTYDTQAPLLQERLLKLDGTTLEAQVQTTSIIYDEKPAVHVAIRDITAHLLADQRLIASKESLRESALHNQTILDNMADGVITINQQGQIETFNKAACTMFGYPLEAVVGHNVSMLMPEPHRSYHDSYLALFQRTGEARIIDQPREVQGLRQDGGLFPMSLSVSRIAREGQPIFIAIARDITQHQQDVAKIRQMAFYDALTGLPNRRLLLDRLAQAMASAIRTGHHGAVMFLDLDHFKRLNDTLGHDAGDVLLQQVAGRLKLCVHADDSVARLGGDEFVVLLSALSTTRHEAAAQAEAMGHKILSALGHPYSLMGHTYTSTPSIGIVVFMQDQESIDELLKKADIAMYQAKAAGRNIVCFYDPAMQAAATAHTELEKDMRRDLAHNQFELYYQIQVSNQGMPIGAEALVRWNHARLGLIEPAHFIPLAEETGLILALGFWVLEAACAQLLIWANDPETATWTMAVNVSALQFSKTDFVATVAATLQKTGANPRLLKLELTESMLLNDIDDIIVKMNAIKQQGVCFSLDDFGTGYSSLSYLKQLPLDQLKIDQSFVQDILTNPNDAVIARTVVALGHSLGLKVVAEGVETQAQRDFLTDIGCDIFQGYYFGRPVPIHQLNSKNQIN